MCVRGLRKRGSPRRARLLSSLGVRTLLLLVGGNGFVQLLPLPPEILDACDELSVVVLQGATGLLRKVWRGERS